MHKIIKRFFIATTAISVVLLFGFVSTLNAGSNSTGAYRPYKTNNNNNKQPNKQVKKQVNQQQQKNQQQPQKKVVAKKVITDKKVVVKKLNKPYVNNNKLLEKKKVNQYGVKKFDTTVPVLDKQQEDETIVLQDTVKTSVFFGAGIGVSLITRNRYINNEEKMDDTLGPGFSYDVKLGWQHYLNNYLGYRVYASFDNSYVYPGQERSNGDRWKYLEVTQWRILGNVDFLFDFIKDSHRSAGLFLGIYSGYNVYTQKQGFKSTSGLVWNYCASSTNCTETMTRDGFTLGFNIGVSFTMYVNHRIEAGAKIPVVDITHTDWQSYDANSLSSSGNYANFYVKIPSIHIWYNYVF